MSWQISTEMKYHLHSSIFTFFILVQSFFHEEAQSFFLFKLCEEQQEMTKSSWPSSLLNWKIMYLILYMDLRLSDLAAMCKRKETTLVCYSHFFQHSSWKKRLLTKYASKMISIFSLSSCNALASISYN